MLSKIVSSAHLFIFLLIDWMSCLLWVFLLLIKLLFKSIIRRLSWHIIFFIQRFMLRSFKITKEK